MSVDKDTEHLNQVTANNEDVFLSQRIQIINEMTFNKQNEEKIKEFMEQQQKIIIDKIKLCHEKELMNTDIKRKVEKAIMQRNELVNLFTICNTLITNNIENLNLFENVMQCCIDNNKIDDLKLDVVDLFEKLKIKKCVDEKKLIEKLNFLKDFYIKLKENHEQNIENCCIMENEFLQNINAQKQNIKIENDKITIFDDDNDKINQEIENIQNETKVLLNNLPELDKNLQDIKNEQHTKTDAYKQKLLDLETILSEITDNYTKKEMEIANFHDGLTYKTEYIKSLQTIKEKKHEIALQLKENILESDQKIQDLNTEFDKERENHNKEIETMTRDIKKMEENINNLDIIYKNILSELETIENEHKELNNKLKTTETNSLTANKQFDHLEHLLEEQFLKFGAEIATLEKNLNEEFAEECGEEQDLEKNLDEMQKHHEYFILQNEAKIADLEIKAVEAEMDTNLTKDEIKITKKKMEDVYIEISELEHETKIKQEELKHDHDNTMQNLSSYFEKLKNKLTNLQQEDVNKKSQEQKKIKETGITLELQVSELTVSTQILQNEVDIKIKELKDMIQKLHNDQKEEKETLKRSVDMKIPKTKIPPSKYSSTSEDSAYEITSLKKRKMTVKRRPDKKFGCSPKSIEQQNTKKSIENILDLVNSGPSGRATRRKRTIKKPVF